MFRRQVAVVGINSHGEVITDLAAKSFILRLRTLGLVLFMCVFGMSPEFPLMLEPFWAVATFMSNRFVDI